MNLNQYIREVQLNREKVSSFSEYPYCLSVIKNLETLKLHSKVTFIIGENGTGKSTILEAIAIAYGLNPEGGTKNFNFLTEDTHSELWENLKLVKGIKKPSDSFFLRAESFYNLATNIDDIDAVRSYGGISLHKQSHGESFMSVIMNRFQGNGLYILDEPEAALSPNRQMVLISRIHDLIQSNSQFIIATHSPIIMSYPDSIIYELKDKLEVTKYEDTEHYKINYIDTTEIQVPIELQSGVKCIGTNSYKGKYQKTYLTVDKDYRNLALAIVGPTRSGKTSLLGNLARDSINAGECVIVLDYIENCGLSEDIKSCISNDKILEVNLYDYNNLQGLGYNEAIKETSEPFYIYESAKQQASQVSTLINSINIEGSEFTPKMQRYLHAACLVAFSCKGAIKDILGILQDHNIRKKLISNVPVELKIYLDEYITYLNELDEWSKSKDNSEVIGTKLNNIVGILDRFSKLKENTYMEMMLKKGIENNINLYEEMEKNQAIFIKMPESMFATPDERDIMTTYWLTKIWIAGQVRAWKIPNKYNRKTVTVITDEIAQLINSERYLGSKLDQTAKFGIKFIISTMYINQLRIKEKLRTANTSYIFISGADKNNFKEMKEEFEEKGFELEDVQKLKRFNSLNYIKYEGGYWAGITKLPQPIKIKN